MESRSWMRWVLAVVAAAAVAVRGESAREQVQVDAGSLEARDEGGEHGKAPNVVVFFVDDLGYGDLGCQGNASVASPNIDKLAEDGVLFTQWLSGASICTPSRGALLTGRLPVRIGLASALYGTRVFNPLAPTGLPHDELTLAEALKERGYNTHMTGKWHLGIGKDSKWLPTHHGFDHYYGMPITNVQSCRPDKRIYTQPTLAQFVFENTQKVWLSMLGAAVLARAVGLVHNRGLVVLLALVGTAFGLGVHIAGTYTLLNPAFCLLHKDDTVIQQPVNLQNLTQRLTADAQGFLHHAVSKSGEGKPWFLYMSYVKVHTALFNNKEFGEDQNYVNNIAEMDWSVGEILRTLDDLGAADNTLVWFSSDNGPFKERFDEGGSSGPLRGGKGQTFEGGIRVPGIARFTAQWPAKQVTNEPVSTMDIFATSLAVVDRALGAAAPRSKPFGVVDGKDISGLVSSLGSASPQKSPHSAMFHYCGEILTAVRLDGRFKAHFFTSVWDDGFDSCPSSSICGCTGSAVTAHDPPLIFDLDADLAETTPLTRETFAGFDDLVKRISDEVATHKRSLETSPNQPNQLLLMQDPRLFVCCNPPSCNCDHESPDPFRNFYH